MKRKHVESTRKLVKNHFPPPLHRGNPRFLNSHTKCFSGKEHTGPNETGELVTKQELVILRVGCSANPLNFSKSCLIIGHFDSIDLAVIISCVIKAVKNLQCYTASRNT